MTDEPFDFEANDWNPEDEENKPDPGVVAFLDQTSAAFADDREQFLKMYGFDHECVCSKDYSEGNLREVTDCFMRMAYKSLRANALRTQEISAFNMMIDKLLYLIEGISNIAKAAGAEKELMEYLLTPMPDDLEVTEVVELPEDTEEVHLVDTDSEDQDDEPDDDQLTLV